MQYKFLNCLNVYCSINSLLIFRLLGKITHCTGLHSMLQTIYLERMLSLNHWRAITFIGTKSLTRKFAIWSNQSQSQIAFVIHNIPQENIVKKVWNCLPANGSKENDRVNAFQFRKKTCLSSYLFLFPISNYIVLTPRHLSTHIYISHTHLHTIYTSLRWI